MAYEFVDAVATTAETAADIPSEGVRIDGEYLENKITGYRTLYTTGRELLTADITTQEVGSQDGTYIKKRRYPERTIKIGFQIIAPDASELMQRFNQLTGILNCKQIEVIFADEPDKYYIGTPSGSSAPDPGRNSITAEWELLCPDPFKRTVNIFEASPSADDKTTITADYAGTADSHPVFEVTFPGDCGYVAFFDADKDVLQFGNPEEVDGTTAEMSETLINTNFGG